MKPKTMIKILKDLEKSEERLELLEKKWKIGK